MWGCDSCFILEVMFEHTVATAIAIACLILCHAPTASPCLAAAVYNQPKVPQMLSHDPVSPFMHITSLLIIAKELFSMPSSIP